MQLSNIPGKLVLPFANAGAKSTIPTASQIGITAGAASLVDGFPPLTRTPIAAGGVPPSGLDMNGILFELSAIARWAVAGGGYAFDGTFAADGNVNGYPKGARVMRSDAAGYWMNTVDNNTVDPESGGALAAGWVPDYTSGVAAVTMTGSSVTLTPAQYGKPIVVITGILTANLNLILPALAQNWTVINVTTGNFTITAKTPSGTGVVVPQNAPAPIVGDGVNIYSIFSVFAADGGAGLIGYSDNGGALITVQQKLRATASDTPLVSAKPCYAIVAVNVTRTTIDRHAFEDWSQLNTTDTALGYCSFDAKATMNNPNDQNHFVGYQSRNIYNGSGNLTNYWHAYDTAMVHNGSGTVALAAGLRIWDITGSGNVTAQYGIKIETLTKGATKCAIWSGSGNTHNFGDVAGSILTGTIQAAGLNYNVDSVGKSISYGYGTAGLTNFGSHEFYDGKNNLIVRIQHEGAIECAALTYLTDSVGKSISYGYGTAGLTNFGSHEFYDGKNNLIVRIDNSGIGVTGGIATTGPIKPGSFTNVTLPVGINGQTTYFSNGRKVGEGAGAGTGIPVYWSNGSWRRYSDDATATF